MERLACNLSSRAERSSSPATLSPGTSRAAPPADVELAGSSLLDRADRAKTVSSVAEGLEEDEEEEPPAAPPSPPIDPALADVEAGGGGGATLDARLSGLRVASQRSERV